ncbi:MAG: RDD family protein [Acidimicrobiia bacterium]|nr:RDD family protein [Acidimicrobiia bacterium]
MADYDENTVTISTPEGVPLRLVVAGLGSRFAAFAVDQAIQWAVLLALYLAVSLLGPDDLGFSLFALVTVLYFALPTFYFVFFETIDRGRSPGKRLVGLRVVRADGSAVTLSASFVRNLLRVVDSLPTVYGVGIVSMLVTAHTQRVGDLVAATLVVRNEPAARTVLGAPAVAMRPAPWLCEVASHWDLSAIDATESAAVRSFLERRHDLAPEARWRLAHQYDQALRPRVAGVPAGVGAEAFLEALGWVKAGRP